MKTALWQPKVGEMVWLNWPDATDPLGRVVGYMPGDSKRRAGQPIIEYIEDRAPLGRFDRGQKKGERRVAHPMFLLPFPYGSKEWKKAMDSGTFDGTALDEEQRS